METPQPTAQSAAPTPASAQSSTPAKEQLQHDSNPFTTTLRGAKKLFKLNTGPLIGTLLFSLLLSVLAILSGVAVIMSIVALTVKNSPENSVYLLQFPQQALDFYSSFTYPAIVSGLILGPILFIGLMALGQTIQLKLFAASSENQHIDFGDLLKQSFKRTLPFVGLAALFIAAAILLVIIIALSAQVLGFLTIVFGLIAFVAAIYFSVRLGLAAFSVIDENMGPIASLKHSWALTRGHFGEMLGISAATLALALVPVIIFDLIALALQSVPVLGVIAVILALVVSFVVGSIAVVGFSERFVQLLAIAEGKATATKTHPANYIALALVIVLTVVMGLITPKQPEGQFNQPTTDQELQQYLDEIKNSQGELPTGPTSPNEQLESEEEVLYPQDSPYNIN